MRDEGRGMRVEGGISVRTVNDVGRMNVEFKIEYAIKELATSSHFIIHPSSFILFPTVIA